MSCDISCDVVMAALLIDLQSIYAQYIHSVYCSILTSILHQYNTVHVHVLYIPGEVRGE